MATPATSLRPRLSCSLVGRSVGVHGLSACAYLLSPAVLTDAPKPEGEEEEAEEAEGETKPKSETDETHRHRTSMHAASWYDFLSRRSIDQF